MKRPKPYCLALLTVFSVLVYHSTIASPAKAAGGDAPDAAAMTATANCSTEPDADANGNQPNPEANRKCKQKPRTLDWQHWSQPQAQGNNLCREQLNGNTVCLTPASAERLHW